MSDTICENDNVITKERSAGRTDTATGVMTEEMVMVLKQRRRLREHMRHWDQDGGKISIIVTYFVCFSQQQKTLKIWCYFVLYSNIPNMPN